jgi:hypothetical protein
VLVFMDDQDNLVEPSVTWHVEDSSYDLGLIHIYEKPEYKERFGFST